MGWGLLIFYDSSWEPWGTRHSPCPPETSSLRQAPMLQVFLTQERDKNFFCPWEGRTQSDGDTGSQALGDSVKRLPNSHCLFLLANRCVQVQSSSPRGLGMGHDWCEPVMVIPFTFAMIGLWLHMTLCTWPVFQKGKSPGAFGKD